MLVEIILKFFPTQLFYLFGCQLLFSQLLIPVPTPPMDSSRWWLSSFCSVGLVGSLHRSGSVLHLIQVLVRVAFQVTPNLQFKTRSNTISCRPRQSSAEQSGATSRTTETTWALYYKASSTCTGPVLWIHFTNTCHQNTQLHEGGDQLTKLSQGFSARSCERGGRKHLTSHFYG